MKKLISMFLSTVMLVCAAPIVSAPSAAEDYSDYNVSSYNVGVYTKPFWDGNVVVNECVFPLRQIDGTLAPFKLVYPATQIISVRNYTLTQTYTYGVDYTLNSNGELVILPGGSIPVYDYRYIHPITTPAGYDTVNEQYPYYPHRNEPGIENPGWEFWEESSKLSTQTICVTYVHAGNDYLTRPEPMGSRLPRTMARLESGQSVKVVTCGDSVTGGAMASGYLGMSPNAPAYPQMTVDGLKYKFNNPNVVLDNSGIGGSTSEWTADLLNRTVINKNPDLVTMCYGMNDSSIGRIGYTDEVFYNNIKGRIDYIKSHLPNCEILLVSSVHGNYYTFPRERYESHARILHEIAEEYRGQGVAVCDPQAIENQMLTRKEFIDFMADNMVHPNDFGMRLITQTICDCLRYGTVEDIAESAVRRVRNATTAARGKDARYEELLEEARQAFLAIGNEDGIEAAIPDRISLIEAEMTYCADGYHAFVAGTVPARCGVAGKTSEVCSYCGFEQNITVIPAIEGDHAFTGWEDVLTATVYNEGKRERHCTKCDLTEEQTVECASGTIPTNKAMYVDFGLNYMDTTRGGIKPYSTCGTFCFDVTPIDVTARSSPGGPCYIGLWIGDSYSIVAGYDFALGQFMVASGAAMPYGSSPSSPYATKAFAWGQKADGTYDRHRIAISVRNNVVKIYCDGELQINVTNSAFSATKNNNNVVLAYTKGEYALDNFVISADGTFDPVTEVGGISWSDDFENGMSHFNATWTLGGYTTVHVDEFSDRGHFPESHTHTNELIASHPANRWHASYDEYECSVCRERTIVYTSDGPVTGHVLERHAASAPTCTTDGNPEYWYCSDCGNYYSDGAGNNEIDAASTVIPALGHNMTYHAASAGVVEYWECSRCGKAFADEAGSTEIIVHKSEATLAVEAKIDALGEVKYQDTEAFSGKGMTATFSKGDSGDCYSVLEVGNANSKLNADYTVEFTMRVRNVNTTTQIGGASGAFFGLFCENFCVGYDFATDQWGLCSSGGLWNSVAFNPSVRGQYGVLDDGVFHDVTIECKTTGIRVLVDGVTMLDSNAFVRQNNRYCILYPRLCTVDFASYALKYNGAWVSDHLTGSALINASTWTSKGSGYGTSVRNFSGSRVVDSGNAIAEAEAAYNALSASDKAAVFNHDDLVDARADYDALSLPAAGMSGVPDSSKITANVYFTLPARSDARNYTATFGENSALLSTMTPAESGYKFSATVVARKLTESIPYSICDFYGNTVKSGAVSVASYARVLENGGYGEDVAALASAMLVYGGAAQRYFGYNTDNLASTAEPTATVPSTPFNGAALRGQCKADASIPVRYTAMNVSFVSDTILWLAFTVKDGSSPADALTWVNENVTLGGKAVSGEIKTSEGYNFIIIKSDNIPISRVTQNVGLNVAGTEYEFSVLNYITAAQISGNADLIRLTRALYAYAIAAEALS